MFDKEKARKRQKAWREAHKAEISEAWRRKYATDEAFRESCKARANAYYQSHKAEVSEKRAAYYREHREELRERVRARKAELLEIEDILYGEG